MNSTHASPVSAPLPATAPGPGPAPLPVTVVIPAYRCAATLPPVLDALFAQSAPPSRVIVVDDASPDDLPSALAPYSSRVETIRHPSNRGLARSYNDGLRAVDTPFAMTLHSDCVLEPRYLESLWDALRRHPEWGAATGQYIFPDVLRMSSTDRLYLALNLIPRAPLYAPGEESTLSFLEGKADLFRTDCLRQVGYFDESFVLTSEDQDLSAKFRSRGWTIGVVGDARFRSAFGGTQDSVAKVLRKQRTYARGQALIFLRHRRNMVNASNANRNARAFHRLAQLVTALLLSLLLAAAVIAAAIRSPRLASIFAALFLASLAIRFISYLVICRWLPIRERPRAAALGCLSDFFYAAGAAEGIFKGAILGRA